MNNNVNFLTECINDVSQRVAMYKGESIHPDGLSWDITINENERNKWFNTHEECIAHICENMESFVYLSEAVEFIDGRKYAFHEIEQFHLAAMIYLYDAICRKILCIIDEDILDSGPLYIDSDFLNKFKEVSKILAVDENIELTDLI